MNNDMAEKHLIVSTQIGLLLAELTAALNQSHEDRRAGKITWGHVGSLGAIRDSLTESARFA